MAKNEKNASAERAKLLFLPNKYANLWRSRCRRRCGCLSSLISSCTLFQSFTGRSRGSGVAQWCELSPPTNVARVRFPLICWLGLLLVLSFLQGVTLLAYFPTRAASILFLSIFGHKIGVLKFPALFQGKELQVTRFKVTCFWFKLKAGKTEKVTKQTSLQQQWIRAVFKWVS